MGLLLTLGQLITGFTILLVGGELLVRSAVSIASRFNISPGVIGLTVIAAGTSAPELGTSLLAALKDSSDIALGNVVGSNMFNLLAILGLSALVRKNVVDEQIIRWELPFLILCTLLFIGVEWDLYIYRWEAFICLIGLFGVFTFSVYRAKKIGYMPPPEEPVVTLKSWIWDTWYMVGGFLALSGGAHLALESGIELGQMWGLSERVIGLTIISVGTGLPELATSVVAAYRGRNDIAVANVIGSNLMNTLGIVGVAATVKPLSITASMLHFDSLILIVMTTLLWPAIWWGRYSIQRPTGAFMLSAYGVYLYLLIIRG